ncbi:MAG: hypothetical protein Q8R64_13075, partial [Sulfurimicrobium sp.]|nr:hypothetical protein [Sulfurimicrobium sp.]
RWIEKFLMAQFDVFRNPNPASVGRNNQRALRRMWPRSAHHPSERHLPRSEAPPASIRWVFPEPEQVECRQQA